MARIALLFFLGLITWQSAAASSVGASFSYPLMRKDPNDLHGYRAALTYQPPSFIWKHISIYFDASYGHWWVGGHQPYRSLNIYSVAPYLRFYFVKTAKLSPYIEASIGASYLTRTRISNRNLGIHYAFQDQLAIGTTFGREQRFYFSLSALHYSNGSFCTSNAGITIPIMMNMGYRF